MKNKSKTICILLGIAVMCILLCLFMAKHFKNKTNSGEEFIREANIIEEYLVIEGLEKEYSLLFLTDTHMVLTSEADSDRVIANANERGPAFMDAQGVSSVEQFPYWMEYANAKGVDAVLFGGDIIDYPSATNIDYLNENLAKLEMPYLYTMGNHDWTYPWEYMTETAIDEYRPLLTPFIKGDDTIQVLEMEDFIVVSIDNSYDNQVPPEIMDTYLELLEGDKPVIVMAHVPFLTQSVLTKAKQVWSSPVIIGGGNYGGINPSEASEQFIKETTAEDSPVIAVLAGHVHFYDKDYIDGDKKVVQIVGDAGFERSAILLHITGENINEEEE